MSYEREDLRAMDGYEWGEQPRDERTIKLNTNENPYPPSPRVTAALQALAGSMLRRYPDPLANALRDGIARRHGLERDQLVMTNGGDEGLRLALTTFVAAGEPFGFADPSYSLYSVLGQIQGAKLITVSMSEDWRLPVDFARTMNEAQVRMCCVVNPHAPSGVLLDTNTISQLANELNGVLLVDEAYVDFVDPALRYESLRLVNAFENLLFLRTFSKGYSLAGARLGYLVGSRALIAPILHKTRDSYNIGALPQAVGLAAFEDEAYAEETWAKVRTSRRELRSALQALGLVVGASQTNFLLAEVPAELGVSAADLYGRLKSRGILVRYFSRPEMEHRLRITVGTQEQNAALVAALRDLLG